MTEATSTTPSAAKIVATQIVITRAEGPNYLCGHPHTFEGPTCWEDARRWLGSQASTFASSGYDKHDFVITWADGNTYDGRLDCKRDGTDTNVAEHVRDFQRFCAGIDRPAHVVKSAAERKMTYDAMMDVCGYDANVRKSAADFLAGYEIPE